MPFLERLLWFLSAVSVMITLGMALVILAERYEQNKYPTELRSYHSFTSFESQEIDKFPSQHHDTGNKPYWFLTFSLGSVFFFKHLGKRLIDRDSCRTPSIISPRLIITSVSSTIWRNIVRLVNFICDYTVVDVPHPTDNLMKELENLQADTKNKMVYFGKGDGLEYLVDKEKLNESELGIKRLLSIRSVLVSTEGKAYHAKNFMTTFEPLIQWYHMRRVGNMIAR